MTRTEEYLTAHPELNELFDVIQTVKNADHVTVTVTTGISHTPVVNRMENPRINIAPIGDEASLLIQGRKTYSFSLSHTKIIGIESATGTTHRIVLSHMGDNYEVELSTEQT